MKSISRVLGFLSKLYWLLSGTIALILVAILVMISIVWINIATGTEFGKYLQVLQIQNDPRIQDIFSLKANWVLIFEALRLVVTMVLNAIIFKGLAKFVEAKRTEASALVQSAALASLPKYLITLYCISAVDLFQLISIQPETDLWAQKYSVWIELAEHILPEFGSPLGLIFAIVIYLFVKSLNVQQKLATEAQELKQEADLVI